MKMQHFFDVDVSFAALFLQENEILEVTFPKELRSQLPSNVIQSSLRAVSNSRAPIVLHGGEEESIFRSRIVLSLSPSIGQPQGIMLLGSKNVRRFTTWEILLLRSLALEFGRALRDLQSRRQLQNLLAALSHELRNPLHVILSRVFHLREIPNGTVTEEHQELLDSFNENAHEMLDLITSLVDLAVVSAGQAEVIKEKIALRVFIEEIIDSIREIASLNGVAVHLEFASDLPHEIVTDPSKLRPIVRNLVDNAVKFTSKGEVSIKVTAQASMLEITVEDTGVGIEKENLKRIFEPFWGRPKPRVRSSGGLGIGLYLVKEFVEFLRGHVYVKSQPGVGSVFTVWVPCG